MNALEALSHRIADLLRADSRRVMLGEDVRDGGMLGLSRIAARDDELQARLLGTPLTNGGLFAHAAGLALGGAMPLIALPSAGALLEAMAKLREIAALSWQSGGELATDVIVLAPSGPGFGLGGEASVSPDSMLAELPGVRVVCPSSAAELGAMVGAAWNAQADRTLGGPTVILLPRMVLLEEVEEAEVQSELHGELLEARTLAHGSQATVIAWGAAVDVSRRAIAQLGVEVEFLDLRSLSPLDEAALDAAARKTGKVVIVHAGARHHGLGAELAARFADTAIWSLDAPILRVTGARGPFDAAHEAARLPSVSAVAEAISQVIYG